MRESKQEDLITSLIDATSSLARKLTEKTPLNKELKSVINDYSVMIEC